MAKAKPRSKAGGKAAFRPQVHVRMYCHGLGDCFLLRFETGKDEFTHVLVDCGIYKASPDAGKLMDEVVDDIVETTGNRLDVLVVTHEHWDHMSGFYQALKKFEDMDIGETWLAWTEDPKDRLANQLRGKYETARIRLVKLMRAAEKTPGAAAARGLADAFNVMAFFGIDKDDPASDVGEEYREVRKLLASKNPEYLSPGQVRPLADTGVKAFVLGPPASETALRRQDIAKRDAYEKQQLAFFDGLDSLLGAAQAALGDDPSAADEDRPFDGRVAIPVDVASQTEFFQTLYGFDADHPEAFRSIDDVAYDSLGSLALRMDNYINNTSLVLAFQLPGGDVLLFPGDAQGGNWKSWADPEKPLAFPDEKTDAHKLLAATVFYKVGHHGSHNATPRTYGLEKMTRPDLRALVPVDHEIAKRARYGEMPLVAIMNALTGRPAGAVFRSDGDDGQTAGDVFKFSQKKLSVRTSPDGEPVKRRLYCETSFDLE